jgi:hypothetical protein
MKSTLKVRHPEDFRDWLVLHLRERAKTPRENYNSKTLRLKDRYRYLGEAMALDEMARMLENLEIITD